MWIWSIPFLDSVFLCLNIPYDMQGKTFNIVASVFIICMFICTTILATIYTKDN